MNVAASNAPNTPIQPIFRQTCVPRVDASGFMAAVVAVLRLRGVGETSTVDVGRVPAFSKYARIRCAVCGLMRAPRASAFAHDAQRIKPSIL